MNPIVPLIAGFVLDCLLGDPHWLPHPIRLFGWLISKFEGLLNKGKTRKLKGAITAIVLIGTTWITFWAISEISQVNSYVYYSIAGLFVFYGLANRSLITEAWQVEKVLHSEGLEAGRKQLSFIVGRETKNLNENQIRTAILETLAENLSDGVIAPLFYYAIGGFPLMMAYKMVNTLDSMIGYKSDRYKEFGWFAAKFDDIVNYVPARITALLMVIITISFRGVLYIFKYGSKHSSPNAGYPEAALAGILNCRFGGPNYYHGKLVEKPFIGFNDRKITSSDIKKTLLINLVTTVSFVAVIVLFLS